MMNHYVHMLLPLIGGEDNRDQTYDMCISI